eukprot:CAMPEP_0119343298 /NCGR_PEP_ID=MMETSP1333-20130426/106372_1 /TAXON_ID=418940 /ORGANISM="Scyphosphaera apsteinii, Strain RCC1455" /LENGTH=93 /DNA_ID=CAMNT_0007355681 /DNA_START=51 /DNA_END=332 /DNA_ORIENTATION=-
MSSRFSGSDAGTRERAASLIGRTLTGFGASTVGAAARAALFAPRTAHPVTLVRAKATFKKVHTASTEGVYNGARKFNKNDRRLPTARSLADLP